jgi:hypothetical protein
MGIERLERSRIERIELIRPMERQGADTICVMAGNTLRHFLGLPL